MKKIFPYERLHEDLLHGREFVRRVVRDLGIVSCAISITLGAGILGYRFIARLPWIDAFLNAAMILGGMGPVTPLDNTPAKLFAGFYALFSGLFFVGMAGVLLAPFLHRLLHEMHVDTGEESSDAR